MAQIVINVNDAIIGDVRKALAAHAGGYSPTLEDGTPNPQTRAEFARREAKRIIIAVYRDWRRNEARAAVDAEPEPDIS